MDSKTIDHLIAMVKQGRNSDAACSVRAEYHDPTLPPIGPLLHERITKSAAMLANKVIQRDGKREDVNLALMNMMVCMDAMKYRLDFQRFMRDYQIQKLREAYS